MENEDYSKFDEFTFYFKSTLNTFIMYSDFSVISYLLKKIPTIERSPEIGPIFERPWKHNISINNKRITMFFKVWNLYGVFYSLERNGIYSVSSSQILGKKTSKNYKEWVI